MNSQLSTLDPPESLDVPLLTEQFVAISEQKRSGLILCKDYHAEFAGPGAAVNCLAESPYRAVIAIGSPELVCMNTLEERRRAYGRRIQWGRWLQRVVDNPEPIVRAEKLLSGFEEFFGRQVVVSLPSEVLAMLAGVFSGTIEQARSQHWRSTRFDVAAALSGCDQLTVTTISLNPDPHEVRAVPLLTTATVSEIERTYAVLRSA